MEILPGIHWLRTVIGTNCWAADTGEALIVIDTGWPGNAKRISRWLKRHYPDRRLDYIVLTHGDIDHGGSAEALRKLTNARIAIHRAEQAQLRRRGNLPFPFRWVSRIAPRLSRAARVRPDILLEDGDNIGGLKVIHLPGHTPGSIGLWHPAGVIFSGDAARTRAGNRVLTPSRPTAVNMEEAMTSLRRLAELDFEILCGGHGPPVKNGASPRVGRLATAIRRTQNPD